MLFVWLTLLIELSIVALFSSFSTNMDITQIVVVSLHISVVTLALMFFKRKYKVILILAFFIRIAFMFWDIYARDVFLLPNSGADSEGFYYSAVAISDNIALIKDSIYGGAYAKSIGLLFYLIGPQRLVAQYINVLLGLSTIVVLCKSLEKLQINNTVIKRSLFIAALFPSSIIMSAVLLREMIITFFVATSIYFFIKWFQEGNTTQAAYSMVFLAIASMFHSGVIAISFGYAFVYLFYNKQIKKYRFNAKTIVMSIFLFFVFVLIFTKFNGIFLGKFSNVESFNDIYSTANINRGSSAYLSNLTINTPVEFLMYGPLKAIYFLFSPLPMNWRGVMDIVTFFSDSILYLIITAQIVKTLKSHDEKHSLILGLALVLLGVVFIFGIGVSNAGTALRHRQKIVPIFILLMAIIKNKNLYKDGK